MKTVRMMAVACLVLGLAVLAAGCQEVPQARAAAGEEGPCLTEPSPARRGDDIPRFGAGSPFDVDYRPPEVKEGKRLWAKSVLFEKAPELAVETWLTEEPDTKGKYVLYEFWATWCPPCRRSISLLNELHRKFGEELVVIGISHETEEAVRKLKEPAIEYFSAIDTQGRMRNELGVLGMSRGATSSGRASRS